MYSFEQLKSIFLDYVQKQKLTDSPVNLYAPVNYLMELEGKRIRPIACLIVANIYTEDIQKALPVVYSIEMFHNFTLMHDDIMDNADMRRSKPSVHVKYDVNTAILSGDLMMIMSYKHILECCDDLILKNKLLKLFTNTAIEVCEGQQYDMDFENKKEVALSDYLLMIKLKTAVLLASTFKTGALIGGADDNDAIHFYDLGLNLGLAFQIQDDLLDTYGNQNTFGKKIGGDIIQNKKTYLYLKALELANDKEKNKLISLYNNNLLPEKEKIEKVKKIFKILDVKKHAEDLIEQLMEKAFDHYHALSVPEEKLKEVKNLMGYLLKRKI